MEDSLSSESQALAAILDRGWIQTADWQPEVDSTNYRAYAALAADRNPMDAPRAIDLPALWVADRQTAGRGRSNHRWWSPSGCLMLTVAIEAADWVRSGNEIGQLALVSGVAKAKTLEQFVEPATPVQLKWPNDAYLAGRKCGGILIESGPGSSWLIGIGLNVRVDMSDAPAEVRDKATSVHQHARPEQIPSRAVVLVELIEQLHHWIHDWASGSSTWLEQWHHYCLLSGRVVHAMAPDGSRKIGLCEGIDGNGQLLIRDELGVTKFGSGEIVDWQ